MTTASMAARITRSTSTASKPRADAGASSWSSTGCQAADAAAARSAGWTIGAADGSRKIERQIETRRARRGFGAQPGHFGRGAAHRERRTRRRRLRDQRLVVGDRRTEQRQLFATGAAAGAAGTGRAAVRKGAAGHRANRVPAFGGSASPNIRSRSAPTSDIGCDCRHARRPRRSATDRRAGRACAVSRRMVKSGSGSAAFNEKS